MKKKSEETVECFGRRKRGKESKKEKIEMKGSGA